MNEIRRNHNRIWWIRLLNSHLTDLIDIGIDKRRIDTIIREHECYELFEENYIDYSSLDDMPSEITKQFCYMFEYVLITSLKSKHDLLFRLLERKANPNIVDENGCSLLHHCKDIELAKILIDHGADVNVQDKTGSTPLHYCQDIELAKVLIDHGADVNIQDKTGRTPFHYCKDIALARMLIDHGADVNVQDKTGSTPLHYCQDIELARILIDHGADVNLQDNTGQTLLHKCGSIELAQMLIEKGAVIDIKDIDNKTPMDTVKVSRIEDYLYLLFLRKRNISI